MWLRQVANCISAPALPAFTALLLLTPPTVMLLASPLLRPVVYGVRLAWAATATNPRVQAYWAWGWSWVIPAGPVARYALGLLLAWADLPPEEGGVHGDMWRVDIGLLWAVGNLLAIVTAVS
jgi:palmitoyltransferase